MDIHELAEKISEKAIDLFLTDPEYYSYCEITLEWLGYDYENRGIEVTCEPYVFEAILKKAVEEVIK